MNKSPKFEVKKLKNKTEQQTFELMVTFRWLINMITYHDQLHDLDNDEHK